MSIYDLDPIEFTRQLFDEASERFRYLSSEMAQAFIEQHRFLRKAHEAAKAKAMARAKIALPWVKSQKNRRAA